MAAQFLQRSIARAWTATVAAVEAPHLPTFDTGSAWTQMTLAQSNAPNSHGSNQSLAAGMFRRCCLHSPTAYVTVLAIVVLLLLRAVRGVSIPPRLQHNMASNIIIGTLYTLVAAYIACSSAPKVDLQYTLSKAYVRAVAEFLQLRSTMSSLAGKYRNRLSYHYHWIMENPERLIKRAYHATLARLLGDALSWEVLSALVSPPSTFVMLTWHNTIKFLYTVKECTNIAYGQTILPGNRFHAMVFADPHSLAAGSCTTIQAVIMSWKVEWANIKATYLGTIRFLHLALFFRTCQGYLCPLLALRWMWRTPLIVLLAAVPTTASIVYARTSSGHRIPLSLMDFVTFVLPVATSLVYEAMGFEYTQDYAIFIITVILQLLAFRIWDYAPTDLQEALDDMTNEVKARFDRFWGPVQDTIISYLYPTDLLLATQDNATLQPIVAQQPLKPKSTADKATQTVLELPSATIPTRFPFDDSTIAAAEGLRNYLDRLQDQIDQGADFESDYSHSDVIQSGYSSLPTDLAEDEVTPTIADAQDGETADLETPCVIDDAQSNEDSGAGFYHEELRHVQGYLTEYFDRVDIIPRQFEERKIVEREHPIEAHHYAWETASDTSASSQDEDEDVGMELHFSVYNGNPLETANHTFNPDIDDLTETLRFHWTFKESAQTEDATAASISVPPEESTNLSQVEIADVPTSNSTPFELSIEATTGECSSMGHSIAEATADVTAGEVENIELSLPLPISAFLESEMENVKQEPRTIEFGTDDRTPALHQDTDAQVAADESETLETDQTTSPSSALSAEADFPDIRNQNVENYVADVEIASQSVIESIPQVCIEKPHPNLLSFDHIPTIYGSCPQPLAEDQMEGLTTHNDDHSCPALSSLEDIAVEFSNHGDIGEKNNPEELQSVPLINATITIDDLSLLLGQLGSAEEYGQLLHHDGGDEIDYEDSLSQPDCGYEPLPPVAPLITAAPTPIFDWQAAIDLCKSISTANATSSMSMHVDSTTFDNRNTSTGGFPTPAPEIAADTAFVGNYAAIDHRNDFKEDMEVDGGTSTTKPSTIMQANTTLTTATGASLSISNLLNHDEEMCDASNNQETGPAEHTSQETHFAPLQLSAYSIAPQPGGMPFAGVSQERLPAFVPSGLELPPPAPNFKPLQNTPEEYEGSKSSKSNTETVLKDVTVDYQPASLTVEILEANNEAEQWPVNPDDINDDEVNSDGLSEPEDEHIATPVLSSMDEARTCAMRVASNIEFLNEMILRQRADEEKMRQCAKEKSDMEALELEILAGLMNDDEDQDQQDMPNPTETSIHTSASTKASGDGPIKKDTVTEWKQSDMRIPVGNHVAQTVDPKAINRPVKALRSRRALESSAKVPGNFSGPGNINILSTTDTHDTTPLAKQSPPVTPLQTQPVASNHDEPTHIGREEFPSVAQQSRSELSHPPIPSRASQPSLSSAPKKEDSRKKYDWSGFYTNRAGKEFIVGGDDSFYEDDGQEFTFDNQGYPVDATTKRPYLK